MEDDATFVLKRAVFAKGKAAARWDWVAEGGKAEEEVGGGGVRWGASVGRYGWLRMLKQPLPCILELLCCINCNVLVLGLKMPEHIVMIEYGSGPSGMWSGFFLASQAHESFTSQNHMLLQLLTLAFDASLNQAG